MKFHNFFMFYVFSNSAWFINNFEILKFGRIQKHADSKLDDFFQPLIRMIQWKALESYGVDATFSFGLFSLIPNILREQLELLSARFMWRAPNDFPAISLRYI
jgi:hypothetical protein